jgi:hypothetical protein
MILELIDIKIKPLFRDKKIMTKEELSDPDYRLKKLQKEYGGKYIIGCSKCHHCR